MKKNLPWIGLGLLLFLVFSTMISATDDVVAQAKDVTGFSDKEIQDGQDLAFQRRAVFWGNALTQLVLLVYLAFTPLGKRLYLWAGALVHGHWFTQLLLLGGVYFLLSVAVGLPFRIASYVLESSWETTTQGFFDWFVQYSIGLVVSAIFGGVLLAGFYVLVRTLPTLWWAAAGAGATALSFFVAFIHPIAIVPLFNTVTPIAQTKYKTYEFRIQELGRRVDIKPANVYVVDASRQTTASNAYFTGLGPTQRIVLYDNLLDAPEKTADKPPGEKVTTDQVEVVIAHEMGHWWHGHILQGILFGGLALTAGFYLLYQHLNALVDAGVLRSAGDPAGVFRVVLLAYLAYAVTLPVQRYASRRMETQADEVALDLSKKPQAFIDGEKQLARQNKMNVAPSRWNYYLFASHPTVVQRIQMAKDWKPKPPTEAPK